MANDDRPEVHLADLIPPAYRKFWHWKGRNLVCKGARGSGKSYAASFKVLNYMMEHPLANALFIRQVKDTLRDSCWATLRQCVYMMGIQKYWKFTKSPLEVTYLPTGQRIMFRGMDDPLKITSISPDFGYITHVVVEEAYQIPTQEAFEVVDFSIRGEFPQPGDPDYDPGLYRQTIFIFNPWSPSTWLKDAYFDKPDPQTLAMTTTYKDNINPKTGRSNLGQDVIEMYEKLYITNPKRARVVCDGEWGASEGLVYDGCWDIVEDFDPVEMLNENRDLKPMFGLDFGFVVSYTAFVGLLVDIINREVWVFEDSIYERGLVNVDIAKRIVELGYGKEVIIADSAEPKSLYDLQKGIVEATETMDGTQYYTWALPNITGIHKTSIEFGISLVQSFTIHVAKHCKNVITELENYAWDKDKDGKYTGKPIKDYDHDLDSVRYVLTTAVLQGSPSVYNSIGATVRPSAVIPESVTSVAEAEITVPQRNPIVASDKGNTYAQAVPVVDSGTWVFGPSPVKSRRRF